VTNNQEAAGAAATLSDSQPRALLKDLFGQVAGCFPRREIRQAARQMADGLLMELVPRQNSFTIVELVLRAPQAALRYSLIKPWTTCLCLIRAVISTG
jgi:hypothetical protein